MIRRHPYEVMDLNEAQQLSQFATVLVLVPATSAEDGRALSQIAKNNFIGGRRQKRSKILEFFNKTRHCPSRGAPIATLWSAM